jgi:hypothetical protein
MKILVAIASYATNNGVYGEHRNIAQSSPELHSGRQSRDSAAKICSAEEVSVDMKRTLFDRHPEGMQ